MLVSINRKNFLRHIADRSTEAALPVSLAATSMAVERGADVVRTHDVAETRDAALVGHALARGRHRAERVAELDVGTARELDRHAARPGVDLDPAAGVARAFERTGLDGPSDRDRVVGAAERAGAAAGLSARGGLLAGSEAALARVAATLAGTPVGDVATALEAALGR
jgi:dihydropteroate synthase